MSEQTSQSQYLPRSERWNNGKALRREYPRRSHGDWIPLYDRPDPIDPLQAQDADRIQSLIPIKYGRMSASPFAFLRGSAAVMANDLASTPSTGLSAVLCGDAHLSNFGLFASPERNLDFDINDFDEAYFGPWEWDLKRLAVSAAAAGRENGFSDAACRDLAAYTAYVYRRAMRRFAEMRTMDIWYYLVDADQLRDVFDDSSSKAARNLINKDYYWRQPRDLKGSVDAEDLDRDGFQTYMGVCALCLARAHARTGDTATIGGYLGKSDAFDDAIGIFAMRHADQTEHDFDLLVKATKSGKVTVESGI